MVAALFGHKDTPARVKPLLEQTLRRLIEENEEITFLVGTHGTFDLMAQSVLKKLSDEYPQMKYHIVLAYYPSESEEAMYKGLPAALPDGFETVPPRFAISHRNNWIVKQCDTVVCYITHDWGGAYTFVEKARRAGKRIINLGSLDLVKSV